MVETIGNLLDQLATNRAVMQVVTVLILLYSLYSVFVLSRLKAYPFGPFVFPVFVAVEAVAFYMWALLTNPPPSVGGTFFSVMLRVQTAAAFALTIKYLIKRIS